MLKFHGMISEVSGRLYVYFSNFFFFFAPKIKQGLFVSTEKKCLIFRRVDLK